MAGTAEFQNLMDTNTETKGIQLPANFENTFGDKASREKIVDAAEDKFANMEPADKTKITDKAAAEIKSWTKMPEKTDPNKNEYSSKIAVLYLYTLLADKKNDAGVAYNHKTANEEVVVKIGNALRTETPKVASTAAVAVKENAVIETSTATTASTTNTEAAVVIKGIVTTTQVEAKPVAKTPEELQKQKIVELQSLQTSDAFNNLPGKIRRDINRILKLQDKDDKTTTKIDRVTKEVEDITKEFSKLTTENNVKQERIGKILSDRDQMKGIRTLKSEIKKLDSEERQLHRDIIANNDKLISLNADLTDKKNYLADLSDNSTTRMDKMEDKLTAVTAVLEEEKIQKTADLDAIKNLHTNTDLTTEITSLQKDIANLVDVQTKITALKAEEPVIKTDVPTLQPKQIASLEAQLQKRKVNLDSSITKQDESDDGIQTEASAVGPAVAENMPKVAAVDGTQTEAVVTPNISKTVDQVNTMTETERNIYTNGLTTINVATATELAKLENGSLQLNGLTRLDPETADALHQLPNGDLYLDGLTSITTETAIALTQGKKNELFNKGLYLNGLTTLDPATAAALNKIPVGNIHINISNWRPAINGTKTDVLVNNTFDNIIKTAEQPITGPDASKYENQFQDILTELHALSETFKEYKDKYGNKDNFQIFEKAVTDFIQSKIADIDNLRNKSATASTNTVRYIGGMTPNMAKIAADLQISQIATDTGFLTIRDQLANQQ